ncbi:outer membrane protein [Legionella dresdenensis]|uniref:Outer membrane protein n=1 Tax=Legionella dresdenensis TaxID=450200 RepID=A0ABV8CBH7_9GAMM
MNKLNIITASLALGLSSTVTAGTMGPVAPQTSDWYFTGGAGYSASRNADIRVFSGVWDNAAQGYNNDLGSTALLFAGVGYYITDYLSIDARYEHRGDYRYKQYQTGANTGTSGFTGSARTRFFDVSSDAAMFSAWLDLGNLSPQLQWAANGITITPFVGAGLGVDYLDVSNFRTVGNSFVDGNQVLRSEVSSINQTTTDSAFAWHVGAGLAAQLTPKTSLAVGYNYFDGGKLPFPNYITSSTTSPNAALGRNGVTVPAWDGRLTANEVYAELRVRF